MTRNSQDQPLCSRCGVFHASGEAPSRERPELCKNCRAFLNRLPPCPGCGKPTSGKRCLACRGLSPQSAHVSGGNTPAEPTEALPGSLAKVAVMAARAAAGLALHHPQDATGLED